MKSGEDSARNRAPLSRIVRHAEVEPDTSRVGTLARLGISAAAGIGAGVVVAILVTVIDLYLTGHGSGSITGEVITWEEAGVHLSFADLAMLTTAVVAAVSTWHLAALTKR